MDSLTTSSSFHFSYRAHLYTKQGPVFALLSAAGGDEGPRAERLWFLAEPRALCVLQGIKGTVRQAQQPSRGELRTGSPSPEDSAPPCWASSPPASLAEPRPQPAPGPSDPQLPEQTHSLAPPTFFSPSSRDGWLPELPDQCPPLCVRPCCRITPPVDLPGLQPLPSSQCADQSLSPTRESPGRSQAQEAQHRAPLVKDMSVPQPSPASSPLPAAPPLPAAQPQTLHVVPTALSALREQTCFVLLSLPLHTRFLRKGTLVPLCVSGTWYMISFILCCICTSYTVMFLFADTLRCEAPRSAGDG